MVDQPEPRAQSQVEPGNRFVFSNCQSIPNFAKAAQKSVRIQEVPFGGTPEQKEAWAWWMARPADWQRRQQQPKLFDVSYRFWRQKVEQLSRQTHDSHTDYRKLSRQFIFDDRWNLVGNPVMVAGRWR